MIIRFWKNVFLFSLRLYGGGGGDGGAKQMQDAEYTRQANVQSAVDAINQKFGKGPSRILVDPNAYLAANPDVAEQIAMGKVPSAQSHWEQFGRNENRQGGVIDDPQNAANAAARDAAYSDISGAVRDTAMRDLDRQYGTASDRNTFGLARSGLMGGSVDAESGGQLQQLYGEGKLKAQEAGMGAAADLRSTDEKSRQNLISLAQSGLDTGTASSMAAGQMAAAADSARGAAAGSTVGRVFDDLSQAYVTNQYTKARYPSGIPQQQSTGYGTNLFGSKGYVGTVGR